MRFLVPLGLLVAVAVIGPLVAHLLRRQRPLERPFPPARLVPSAPPIARRRAHIEDRWLLAVRAIAILALALLAASPLVRCSQLALDRKGGASIALAIVLDDSMSMRAELPPAARRGGATTRWALAIVAAQELAGSLRAGDVTLVVLAGAPARLALPPTGEAATVRAVLDTLSREGPSDRGTDLDGALALAASAMRDLPQTDRRMVLLSDLADGGAAAGAIAVPTLERLVVEAPLEGLRADPPSGASDCAALAASPEGADAVRVRVSCALHGAPVGERAIDVVATEGGARAGTAPFPPSIPEAPQTFEVLVQVDPSRVGAALDASSPRPTLFARLRHDAAGKGRDAIASDDATPVLGVATAPAIGVVVGEGGALDEVVATGGAPLLERALEALQSGATIRPLPSTPDRKVDLAPFAALAIDDPPGLAPEAREALDAWVDEGGVLLLAVGPRAASPPLGQSLAPFLQRPVRWEKVEGPLGVDPAHGGPLGDGASLPTDLAPKGRAIFDREDVDRMLTAAAWKDGVPLLATRARGQGEAWLVNLPFAPETSDLPLRPAFLAMLSEFVERTRDRGAGARLEVGKSWTAGPDDALEAVALDEHGQPTGPPLALEKTAAFVRITPRALGAYSVTTTPRGGTARRDLRAVVPLAREVDLAARSLPSAVAAGERSGLRRTTAELAPALAWILLLLAGAELVARAHRLLAPKAEGTSGD